MKKHRKHLQSTFFWPIILAVLSVFGLIIALTGEGWRDAVSWLALAAPIIAIAWAVTAKRS